jgi:hypothetical protein
MLVRRQRIAMALSSSDVLAAFVVAGFSLLKRSNSARPEDASGEFCR